MKRIKMERKRRIVIIGGSHSGFSAAWMLLNGPASLLKNTHITPQCQETYRQTGEFQFPEAVYKTIESCPRCCTCQYTRAKGSKQKCACVCRCFGFFRYQDWGFDYEKYLPEWEAGDIKILYRDKIKVFYKKVADAAQDGYRQFCQETYSKPGGFLYAFSGLRGDAKKLYTQIMHGQEDRVRLIRASTPQEQQRHVEMADLVIYACGYQTNPIQIRESDKRSMSLSQRVPFTQYDVDSKCRLITSDYMYCPKLFGSGLAYPLRTSDGMVVQEAGRLQPRADSFSLYMNHVGNTMLSNLLPKGKLEHQAHKFVRPGYQQDHISAQKEEISKAINSINNSVKKKHRSHSKTVKTKKVVKLVNDQQLPSNLTRKAQQGVDSYIENTSALKGCVAHHRKRSFIQSNSSTRSSSKTNKQGFKTLTSNTHNKQLSYSPIITTQKQPQWVSTSPYPGVAQRQEVDYTSDKRVSVANYRDKRQVLVVEQSQMMRSFNERTQKQGEAFTVGKLQGSPKKSAAVSDATLRQSQALMSSFQEKRHEMSPGPNSRMGQQEQQRQVVRRKPFRL